MSFFLLVKSSLCILFSAYSIFVYVVYVFIQEQWGHVEEIELMNDGSGLGFGIVGGKASGVVVRTVVPNSIADKVCVYVVHLSQN